MIDQLAADSHNEVTRLPFCLQVLYYVRSWLHIEALWFANVANQLMWCAEVPHTNLLFLHVPRPTCTQCCEVPVDATDQVLTCRQSWVLP